MEREIDHRIHMYGTSLNLLYLIILRDPNIPQKVKVLIYGTILRPILTYGTETCTLTSNTKSKVQAAEMKALRLIKDVTRLDRLRNITIQNSLKIESILTNFEKAQLQWHNHIKRVDQERYSRRFLEWQPGGRRTRGSPGMRWIQKIKDALEKRGGDVQTVEEKQLQQNRRNWRLFTQLDH
ncbi:uncharacterized protein LOC143041291 [Oratosquilla oratoria]|uniref:uncharacterized protein LOC143041291 n=1 Tax=Oratosquilla oratoria TaxID=337810 RepID=UPI003F766834